MKTNFWVNKSANILNNKEFLKLWTGQMFAHFSDAVVQIALIAWIISFLNIAGQKIATVFFFFLLPQFLLSPFTGAIADKFNRKFIMCLSNVYRGCLILFAALSIKFLPNGVSHSKILCLIYLIAFALGFGYTFFYSAKMACMTNVVEPARLKLANTINSGSVNFINILGAAAAGIILTKVSLFKLLIATSVMYFAAACLFACINIIYPQVYKDKFSGVFEDIKFALKYLTTHKIALQIILISVLISLIISTFTNALNTLTVDYYHLGIYGITWFRIMMATGIIVGMVLTLYLSKIRNISGIMSFGFFILFLALVSAPLCKTVNMAWFWLLPIGVASVLIMVMVDTALQKSVADRIRGKVFGFQLTMNTFAFLIGALVIMFCSIAPFVMMKYLGFVSLIYTLVIIVRYFRITKKINKV